MEVGGVGLGGPRTCRCGLGVLTREGACECVLARGVLPPALGRTQDAWLSRFTILLSPACRHLTSPPLSHCSVYRSSLLFKLASISIYFFRTCFLCCWLGKENPRASTVLPVLLPLPTPLPHHTQRTACCVLPPPPPHSGGPVHAPRVVSSRPHTTLCFAAGARRGHGVPCPRCLVFSLHAHLRHVFLPFRCPPAFISCARMYVCMVVFV